MGTGDPTNKGPRPTTRTTTISHLVNKIDPGARTFRPIVYYFSGGRTKRDKRVPFYAETP